MDTQENTKPADLPQTVRDPVTGKLTTNPADISAQPSEEPKAPKDTETSPEEPTHA